MIASFIAVWTALLLVAISVIGTIIMRRVCYFKFKYSNENLLNIIVL